MRPTRELPDRRHPHRLPRECYRHPEQPAFVTFCARRDGCLVEPAAAEAILATMGRLGKLYGVWVHAYCLMPEHLHAIASVAAEGGDLEAWVRYVKRGTARTLRAAGLWQRSYWDRHARTDREVADTVDYILHNSVRGGLCERWQDWPYAWSQWDPESRGPDPNA